MCISSYAMLFQFHKVQLTLRVSNRKFRFSHVFQFHKVQLTLSYTAESCFADMFQFHKVQLTPCPSTNAIT